MYFHAGRLDGGDWNRTGVRELYKRGTLLFRSSACDESGLLSPAGGESLLCPDGEEGVDTSNWAEFIVSCGRHFSSSIEPMIISGDRSGSSGDGLGSSSPRELGAMSYLERLLIGLLSDTLWRYDDEAIDSIIGIHLLQTKMSSAGDVQKMSRAPRYRNVESTSTIKLESATATLQLGSNEA